VCSKKLRRKMHASTSCVFSETLLGLSEPTCGSSRCRARSSARFLFKVLNPWMVSENRTSCHPKSAARTATITEHARCLNGTSAIFVGNSETIELLEWLMSALRCCHRGLRLVSRFKHCSRKSSNFRFTATCKQDLYTEQPYHAECEGLIGPDASAVNRELNATYFATSTLDFRWKTDMFSQRHDSSLRALVERRSAVRPTILILGGGVAHFTRFAGACTHSRVMLMLICCGLVARWLLADSSLI